MCVCVCVSLSLSLCPRACACMQFGLLKDVNLAEMPHYFVAPAFDINVGNAVRQLGTFDLGQSYALQTLCKAGDVVIDVGPCLSFLREAARFHREVKRMATHLFEFRRQRWWLHSPFS